LRREPRFGRREAEGLLQQRLGQRGRSTVEIRERDDGRGQMQDVVRPAHDRNNSRNQRPPSVPPRQHHRGKRLAQHIVMMQRLVNGRCEPVIGIVVP